MHHAMNTRLTQLLRDTATTALFCALVACGGEARYLAESASAAAKAAGSIKSGEAVRWTIVSGPPHNVSFWPDSVPASAAVQLAANMPEAIAALTGPLQMNAADTYVVSFAGLPSGAYRYYCTPHLALGMKAVITVE